jgi:hypothetical protein
MSCPINLNRNIKYVPTGKYRMYERAYVMVWKEVYDVMEEISPDTWIKIGIYPQY